MTSSSSPAPLENGGGADHFADRLVAAVLRCGNPVLVGLDPRLAMLPEVLADPAKRFSRDEIARLYGTFCHEIVDVVAPLVPAVKFQAAFFEQLGPPGMSVLAEAIEHARQSGLLVILDGKRNDIGSTAAAYADAYLGPGSRSAWGADALTANPYLGDDALQPLVETARQRGAGVFVLVKTSNPGGGLFQDLIADGQPVYRHVARYVEQQAIATVGRCQYGIVGAVVGATYPEQLAQLREAMPHTWFLVPGFGAQGAGAGDVAGAFDSQGLGAIVNSSRGIIFAFRRSEYAERFAPGQWQRAVELATCNMIDQLRSHTPAGALRSGKP